MRLPAFIPSASSIAREALIVVAGAILAACIVGQLPELKQWIKQQWSA